MKPKTIAAIVPVRNRSGARLENCLRSLRWQDFPAEELDIVLSDFGSNPEHLRSVRALAEQYKARVMHVRTDETWNRSRALNIGVQFARTEMVFCTDVDMIFQPNFIGTLVETYRKHRGEVMVLSRCFDLPEEVPQEKVWNREDFAELRARSALRDTKGTGACQVAARSFFEYTRGYDEQYVYWGAEDVDMSGRALLYGLRHCWLDFRESTMLHQWHPTTKYDRRLRVELNRMRYRRTRHQIVKNKKGWGVRS